MWVGEMRKAQEDLEEKAAMQAECRAQGRKGGSYRVVRTFL
jgi:hypothetical protein